MNREQYNSDPRYAKVLEKMDLLGIMDISTTRQSKNGTIVWRLPIKNQWKNGKLIEVGSFKSGMVRNQNSAYSNYQLNKCKPRTEYFKDYKWDEAKKEHIWTGKYRKSNRTERILIDRHDDRVVYLCNYILKNYYRSNKYNLVENYTMWRVAETHGEWWRSKRNQDDLPFFDGDEHDLALEEFKKIPKESFTDVDDIKVIINDKCYKLIK